MDNYRRFLRQRFACGVSTPPLPFISVVVPAHNEEQYLPHCLRSFMAQEYGGQYEVIVVDNVSTDGTAEVARSFGAKVISCPRKGVVYARQAGAMAAAGEIVVQADADTVYPSDWLCRVAQHFVSHPNTVALAGDIAYIRAPSWTRLFHLLHHIVNAISLFFTRNAYLNYASNFAFRRRAFLHAGGYEVSLPYCGDEHAFLMRLRRVGKVDYDRGLMALTSARRQHGGACRFLFVQFLYHSVCSYLVFKAFRRSSRAPRPAQPRVRQPALLSRRLSMWALVPLLVTAVFVYGYFSPTSTLFGKVYASIPAPRTMPASISHDVPRRKLVALTFDDGPNGIYTEQVLDILQRYGVRATFFVVGQNVEYYPELVQRIKAEGHVLGNHSYSHKAFVELKPGAYEKEVAAAQKTIERVAGVKPKLFRPPFGRKTPWELDYVRKKGLITVTWTVSANDPHASSPQVIAQRIIQRTHPGAIILLHDGNENRHNADRTKTVAALPQIIEALQAQGYNFVTVDELLGTSPYLK